MSDKISPVSSVQEVIPSGDRQDHPSTHASQTTITRKFVISSLWADVVVNPINGKAMNFPILNLRSRHVRAFHLSWLGFFSAFLSWFAFSPLMPEAIRDDLHLTAAEVGNSNIVALCATLITRFALGPLVDRWGPRWTMAAILVAGSIPSGLAGTISSAGGLYAIRFFIGILGGTFVPCQAWTTAFFDKKIVGTANAFAGGWGNLGGGVTFVVMVSLFERLVASGLSKHSAWRAAFAIVPVPVCLLVAAACILFGTDCPAGKWSARHTLPASLIAARHGHLTELDSSERRVVERKMHEKEQGTATVQAASDEEEPSNLTQLDVAVAEKLTWKGFVALVTSPQTWLPAAMYMTTFGYELAIDANLANVFYNTHKGPSFGQTKAGYYAATFGLLNIFTRSMGGWWGDLVYPKYGVRGKKYLTAALGFLQGLMSLAIGIYQEICFRRGGKPTLGGQMAFTVLLAIFCEAANGANFSLVPHVNPRNNGVMSGLVGAFGNLGGIWFALMFRFHVARGYAAAFWIAGVFAIVVNLLCCFLPVPADKIEEERHGVAGSTIVETKA